MTQPIPRDPTAMMLARLIIGLIVLLVVLSLIPRQTAPLAPIVRAQAPITIVVTPTAHPTRPGPPEPQHVQVVEAAPTVAPVPAVADVPVAVPPSQIVHNADGSISLPGSEAWMGEQPAVTNTDPALQIARDAATAYQQLPVAQPPSAENEQPVTVRRPHTGR